MAANELEAQALESWTGAFQVPVNGTRHLEKQLRAQVSADRDRLRTLVGASYRSLLKTAEQIIRMHEQTQEVEVLVGHIGQRCNSTALEAIKRELREVKNDSLQQSYERRKYAAQLALLERCRTVVAKLLKRSGSLSLAAKLLTISRLLHKTLPQRDSSVTFLETLRSRITASRRELLVRIDRRLTSPKSTFDQLLDAMSAFCLATSSSSIDVLKHFQALRLDLIRGKGTFSQEPSTSSSALYSWIQTLRTTKELVGRRLSDTFKTLQKQPIMNDPGLVDLEGMNLDLYRRWVAPEVLNFVPWMKSVELSRNETSVLLESWSKSALKCCIDDLEKAMGSTDDLSCLLAIRSDVFHAWLPVWKSTPSHSNSSVVNELRAVLNDHLKQHFRKTGHAVLDVLNQLQGVIENSEDTRPQNKDLWTHSYVTSSLENGAESFNAELVARHSGQSLDLSTVLRSLDDWIATMRENKDVIEGLRKMRWLDLMEEEDDDDETEAMTLNRLLQFEDPNIFTEAHDSGLVDGLTKFQARLYRYFESKGERTPDNLLRLIRGVCQKLSTAFPQSNLEQAISTIPRLHDQLASEVLETMVNSCVSGGKLLRGKYLWEGQTPTPIAPSPRAIKFLRLLIKGMVEHGEDLWVAPAVDTLKRKAWSAVVNGDMLYVGRGRSRRSGTDFDAHDKESLRNGHVLLNGSTLNGTNSDLSNGIYETSEAEKTQTLFDVLFLRAALLTTQINDSDPGRDVKDLDELITVDQGSVEELSVKANAYWERTHLLFGPLAI